MSISVTRAKACVAGIGETEYRRWGGIADRNEFQLAGLAIAKAVADAGLRADQVDGFACFADSRGL